MLRRFDFQILIIQRSFWPVALSLILHAMFLALVSMPRAPKIPEFMVVEMASLAQLSAPAVDQQAKYAQRVVAAAPREVQSQPVEKRPEMAEPVKHVPMQAPGAQTTAPALAQAVSTGQSITAPGVKSGVAVSGKTGPAVPSGPVDGVFGASDGPAIMHSVQPVYPRIARKLGKEGAVLLRIILDEKGVPTSVVVVEKAGHGFDEAAVKAVKASKFRAARQRGNAVACRVLLPIRFKLED